MLFRLVDVCSTRWPERVAALSDREQSEATWNWPIDRVSALLGVWFWGLCSIPSISPLVEFHENEETGIPFLARPAGVHGSAVTGNPEGG